jgi:DNA processing protein
MIEERAYWLAWSQLPGVGAVTIARIQQHFGTLSAAWTASERSLIEVNGLGGQLSSKIVEARSRLDPEAFLERHLEQNTHFWTPADPDYPRLLLEIPSPPPVLYYQGQVERGENSGITPLVGIVGTRSPTAHGRRWTRKISINLIKSGFTVVSGMAAGIDGEAHRACLESGGRTLAVLGTGLNVVYPQSHRQLHAQIQQQGLLLSEYPAGTPPNKGNFPARNRIIAGLSRAILVMEAPEKSGALITAKYANEFGRDVYTLPNSPDVAEARGCLRLIRQGAEEIIQEDELLEMLGAIPKMDDGKQLSLFDATAPTTSNLDLSPEFVRVLNAIALQPTPLELIVRETGLSVAEVSAILIQLELLDLVLQLPGMRYQKK